MIDELSYLTRDTRASFAMLASEKDRWRCTIRQRLEQHKGFVHEHSCQIWQKLLPLLKSFRSESPFRAVMIYLNFAEEVETLPFLDDLRKLAPTLAVPYIDGDDLRLFRIESLHELERNSYGILEPTKSWKKNKSRVLAPAMIDAAILPGLAFDLQGNRLGRGRGFIDRLLIQLPPHTRRIALAFECQMVDLLTTATHDERVSYVVTERNLYQTSPTIYH